jgi:AraC family transcriptional regulator, regulatory protein of adaptative response / methylated-DNA-[protein]-cysteine methyltransferase
MKDRIRYAWGRSPHGDFFVAMADHELVAFEFPARRDIAVEALRHRFSGKTVEEDASGLASTVAELQRFVDHPDHAAWKDRTLSDNIRYAWGKSSLGDFISAWSDQGLVVFEFADHGGSALETLRNAFPSAAVAEDVAGLASATAKLAQLVDHPGEDPGIALDLRGSEYEKRVWSLLREIPAGKTVSYGDIAARLGTRDARDVTTAIAANHIAILIPCHRVVKKDGSLSGYRWGAKRKRTLLERERIGGALKRIS